jgi:miniconductance mechanosensitive channel
MEESGGRRIKRAVFIKISSISFCNEKMLEKFRKINLITSYIDEKLPEIKEHNKKFTVDNLKGNQRNFTNIGLFRVYLNLYLESLDKVNKDMAHVVRQLAPTDKGLPIEIYCFAYDKEWANFEDVQADIFDHVFSAVRDFELEMFESPSSEFTGVLDGEIDLVNE